MQEVREKQASTNTVFHCLYDFYFLGFSKKQLSSIYCKSKSTITRWIHKFEKDGTYGRKQLVDPVYRKFDLSKRMWVVELYKKSPILFRREAQNLFHEEFGETISTTAISVILHQAGFSWKVLERRAIQIRMDDIVRYTNEMNKLDWFQYSLVFLDEVSFDNRDMLRNKGYGVRGERLIYRGEFNRRARVSLLCFMGVQGVLEVFETDGTFTRAKFIDCCKKFALSTDTPVRQYPGYYSIWVLDGAKIHCHPKIVQYLRSLGIIVVFLPAYCPQYNPIEVLFHQAKQKLKAQYKENCSNRDLKILLGNVMMQLSGIPMENLFKKCGYFCGHFDPGQGFSTK